MCEAVTPDDVRPCARRTQGNREERAQARLTAT